MIHAPIHLAWPANLRQYELWSEVVLAWMVANHAVAGEWAGRDAFRDLAGTQKTRWKRILFWRTAIAGTIVFLLPGLAASQLLARLMLGGVSAITTGLLRWARLTIARSERWHPYLAELEVVGTAAFLLLTASIVGATGLTVKATVLLPLTIGKWAALCVIGAAIAFVTGGGTHIVRGVLDKVQALPTRRGSKPTPESPKDPKIDLIEYNRGRTIGNLERVLMLALIGGSSYEALGLLVAAKGLIRASEFDNRDLAEYFIVGNLCSVAVAMAVGLPLRRVVSALWQL